MSVFDRIFGKKEVPRAQRKAEARIILVCPVHGEITASEASRNDGKCPRNVSPLPVCDKCHQQVEVRNLQGKTHIGCGGSVNYGYEACGRQLESKTV